MQQSDNNVISLLKTHDLNYQRYFGNHGAPWPIFYDIHEASPVERLRDQFPTLSSVADVLGAATVSEAYDLKPLIKEHHTNDGIAFNVINSGTIDRYSSLWGKKRLRYLGDSYLCPIVPSDSKEKLQIFNSSR